eukprot:PhF_6_TR19120/c0_g1_i1/m.28126/K02183/CALM; calmodulin
MTGNLSQQQIAEYMDAFDLFDVEGEGKITLDKIACVLNSLGQAPNEYALSVIMRSKQEEGEDSIELYEFLSFMADQQTLSIAQESSDRRRFSALEEAFALLDPSDSGVILASDLRRIVKDVMKEHDVDALIAMGDTEGTGRVYYKELAGILMQGA